MENLDLSFLANMPKGRELYSTVFGVVTFQGIDESSDYPAIKVYDGESSTKYFSFDGKIANLGECVLFPSKDCRDWNDWQRVLIKQSDFTIDSFGGVEYIENKYKDNSIAVRFATSARKANFERSFISCWASSEYIAEFKKELSGNGWLIDKNGEVVKIVQPKVELTQLDKNILEAAIAFVELNNHFNCWGGIDKHTVLSALYSLRPQNTWKPSEGQMDALEKATSSLQSTALESLYNELKKLMEE